MKKTEITSITCKSQKVNVNLKKIIKVYHCKWNKLVLSVKNYDFVHPNIKHKLVYLLFLSVEILIYMLLITTVTHRAITLTEIFIEKLA